MHPSAIVHLELPLKALDPQSCHCFPLGQFLLRCDSNRQLNHTNRHLIIHKQRVTLGYTKLL